MVTHLLQDVELFIGTKMKSYLIIGALFLLVLYAPLTKASSSESADITIYIYGSNGCSHCVEIKDILTGIYGEESVAFYEMLTDKNAYFFNEIYSKVFPGKTKDMPLVGIFRDSVLVGVVGGYHGRYLDETFWKGIENNTFAIGYWGGETFEIKIIERIGDLFIQKVEVEEPPLEGLLLPLMLAAAADSINPCAFAVFIVLLTLISFRIRKKVLRSGLSFVTAIFIAYLLMGFGLLQIFGSYSWLKYLVAGFGIFIATLQISNFLAKHHFSPIPKSFQRQTRNKLEKVASPRGAFVVGVFVSLFLLPCTAGPYFIAVSLISSKPSLGIPLILLYNVIFIIPFIVILYGFHKLAVKTSHVKRWRQKIERALNLVAGIIILILSIYLIIYS